MEFVKEDNGKEKTCMAFPSSLLCQELKTTSLGCGGTLFFDLYMFLACNEQTRLIDDS